METNQTSLKIKFVKLCIGPFLFYSRSVRVRECEQTTSILGNAIPINQMKCIKAEFVNTLSAALILNENNEPKLENYFILGFILWHITDKCKTSRKVISQKHI